MATLKELEKRVFQLENEVKELKGKTITHNLQFNKEEKEEHHKTGEENVGINVLAYVGTIAFIFSLGFLFFLSFDNSWFSNGWINVIILLVIGHCMTYLGHKLWNNHYHNITRMVLVAGTVLSFFSIFSSYVSSEIKASLGLTMELAVLLLSIIVLEVALVCIKKNSKYLLMQFLLFGLITSFIAEFRSVFSLSFLLIVAIAGLIITTIKRWNVLNIPIIIISYLYFGISIGASLLSREALEPTFLIFLILFYLIFNIASYLSKEKEYNIAEYTINNVGFLLGGSWLGDNTFFGNLSYLQWVLILGLLTNASFYFVDKKLKETTLWTGLAFFSILMIKTLSSYYDTLILATVSVAFLIFGFIKNDKTIRIQGLSLVIFSFLKLLVIDTAGMSSEIRVVIFFVFSIIMIFGSILYIKYQKTLNNQ